MRNKIISKLKELEKEHDIKILMAVEAGSRVWGFESKNSDYDIRFIYCHFYPKYNLLFDPTDQIDFSEGDLDMSGWDIKKCLKLLLKCNPSLLEWIWSPTRYIDLADNGNSFIGYLRNLYPYNYNNKKIFYHYLHMAKNNIREYLKGERVWLKKYLYVIRPLLICNYIEQFGNFPPLHLPYMIQILNPRMEWGHLIDDLNQLIKLKKEGNELSLGNPISSLQCFIENEMKRLSDVQLKSITPQKDQAYDNTNRFYTYIIEHNKLFT